MNEDNTNRYQNLAVVSNVIELIVTTMEQAGGNEVVTKEVPEMAQDAAAIINTELGALS